MYYCLDYDKLIIITINNDKIISIEDVNSNILPLIEIDIKKYTESDPYFERPHCVFDVKSKAIDRLVNHIICHKLDVKINFDSYIKIIDNTSTVEYYQSCGKINGYYKLFFSDYLNEPYILEEYIDGKSIKLVMDGRTYINKENNMKELYYTENNLDFYYIYNNKDDNYAKWNNARYNIKKNNILIEKGFYYNSIQFVTYKQNENICDTIKNLLLNFGIQIKNFFYPSKL